MGKSYDLITLFTSVAWCIFSVFLMTMFAASRLGQTPVYLPLFLAFISLNGVLVNIWWARSKRIRMSYTIVSIFLYTIAMIFQIKALAEIMYVA